MFRYTAESKSLCRNAVGKKVQEHTGTHSGEDRGQIQSQGESHKLGWLSAPTIGAISPDVGWMTIPHIPYTMFRPWHI